MALSQSQRGVAIGAAAAMAITIAGLALAASFADAGAPALDTRLSTLALSLLCPALALLVCIGRLASHRFFTPADIDGSGLTDGTPRAKVLQALLQNTLEQVVLALLVYLACTFVGSARLLAMVSLGSVLFLVGRLFFFHGYERGAPGRAFGFGLTFYPTVFLLFLACFAALGLSGI